MDYSQYIDRVSYEAALKQRLANLIGRGLEDLSSLSVQDLVHEVEVQKKDYIHLKAGKVMEPTIEDAYLYLNNGFPFN